METSKYMTQIISAFPCLGKTTIYQLNKGRTFDREFNESRSVLGMSEQNKEHFYELCGEILRLQIQSNHYDYIFITDYEKIANLVANAMNDNGHGFGFTYIFPDVFNKDVMQDYYARVIKRSGVDWYERVIVPKLVNLSERIIELKQKGYDVRLTDLEHPYIEDVFCFNSQILLPNEKNGTERIEK